MVKPMGCYWAMHLENQRGCYLENHWGLQRDLH